MCKIAEFTLESLCSNVKIDPSIDELAKQYPVGCSEVKSNNLQYQLNKPIKGYIEFEYNSFYFIWDVNPSGKTGMEQGSPIIGLGKSLQESYDAFLIDLIHTFDDCVETPDDRWHQSAKVYVSIMKSLLYEKG